MRFSMSPSDIAGRQSRRQEGRINGGPWMSDSWWRKLSKIDGALFQATLQFSSRLDAVVGCLTRQSELFHLVGVALAKLMCL
jgi:hypothetical protein